MTRHPKPDSPLSPTTTSYLYNPAFNKPTRVTDALGRVSQIDYDPWTGNALAVTADVGVAPHFNARTQLTYNWLGLVTSATDPMGTVTRFDYDALGNRISSIADAGIGRLNLTTTWAYNALGDVVSVTDPKGNVATRTYDAARRLLTTTAPPAAPGQASVVSANTYDPDGRLVQVQQSAGGSVLRTTSSTYTPSGKVATATDPAGNVTRFAYDQLDRQATVTDAMGRVTQFTYDALGRPYRTYNTAIQAGPLVQRTYTADGQLATLADANGNTTSFAYDGFDRLATTTYPLGSTEAFTYDALDNLLGRKTRAAATTNIAFGYDTLNRLVSKTPTSGPAVTYSYDLNSRPTGVSDNSAAIVAAVPPGGSTVTYGTSYAYDALNRLTGTSWDPAPAATAPTAGPLVTFNHTYNKVNQRIGQTVDDSTWLSYPMPAPKVSYTANPLNQYTAIAVDGGATVNPTYDNNGNLTSDGSYSYAYDPENRLLTATLGGSTATYAYDAQGRRKSRTVGGTTTIFITDADNREVLEYDGSTGAVTRWYAYGLGPNDVLGQMNVSAGTRTMPIPDLLGSIVGSVDAGTGGVTKFGYLPYGGGTPAMPFGFTGQRFDSEAGLYYYRARHYSTAYGRFLQADPAGYDAGANLYAYVSNDPLNLIDPAGLSALSAVTSLAQTMVDPWVGFYQQTIVQPFYAAAGAIARSPVGDPGLYASLQRLGPAGAFASSAGQTASMAIGAVARWGGSTLRPIAGGGASLDNLAAGEVARIQNAANRTQTEISVVGSRARGTAHALSDWDYVVPSGTTRSTRHSLSSSLPEGPRSLGERRKLDIFAEPVDINRPYITFTPSPR